MGSMLIICILDTAPIMDYRICNNTVFRLEEVIDFCEADLVFFMFLYPRLPTPVDPTPAEKLNMTPIIPTDPGSAHFLFSLFFV